MRKRDCGGVQRWSGVCSVAQCTVLCSPFPSSRHHPEHEHFFNHSRESRAEPSGGRMSHCSVCSHHPLLPSNIATPHSSITPALHVSSSLPFPSPFFLSLLTLFLLFFFLSLTNFFLCNHLTPPCLHHFFCLSVSLCHLFILFFLIPFIAPSHPHPFLCHLALDG